MSALGVWVATLSFTSALEVLLVLRLRGFNVREYEEFCDNWTLNKVEQLEHRNGLDEIEVRLFVCL